MAMPHLIFLRPNEELRGYIFVCNEYALPEFIRRRIFGLPYNYRVSVRRICPGTPLFLYNYSTRRLHGIYEATSYGGLDMDPYVWPMINSVGHSFYPAQVRVRSRLPCRPLPLEVSNRVMRLLSVGEYPNELFRVELRSDEARMIMNLFRAHDAGIQLQ